MTKPSRRSPGRTAVATIAIALLAGALGILLGKLAPWRQLPDEEPSAPATTGASVIGTHRPPLRLPDSVGRVRDISEWDGRVLVVNFWATWCAPCRKEIPMLSALQRKLAARSVQVIGVALDDPARIRAFEHDLDMTYPSLVVGPDVVEIGARFGNRLGVLPFTAIVDQRGIIRWTHFGPLDAASLERELEPLL